MKINAMFAVAAVAFGAATCAFGAVEDPVEYIRGELAAGRREIKDSGGSDPNGGVRVVE